MKGGGILVVDDDASLRRVMRMQLREAGYSVTLAASADEGLQTMEQLRPELVISDLRMPGTDGMDMLHTVRERYPSTTVILMTAFGTVDSAVRAMKAGAYDYVTKPIDYEALRIVVERALERQNLLEQIQMLRSALDERYGFEQMIGHSKALLRVLDQASRVAQHNSTVLILGETGTGKELLARAIHRNSRRKDKPFVTINCAAIPRDLLESELFGFKRGSFTGAHAPKAGKVELADGGTLFLDEVGEIPVELQAKLLRLLQQGEVEKVGGEEPVTVDVRVVAATHRNLPGMVEDGLFREDLYYRLSVVPLEIPPLRERKEDIPELTAKLFAEIKERRGLRHLHLSPAVFPHLVAYRWPGNVRELENILERMAVLASDNEVGLADLPMSLQTAAVSRGDSLTVDMPDDGLSLEGVERDLIRRALERFEGNQSRAARYLDISRRTLIYRMEKYGMRRDGAE